MKYPGQCWLVAGDLSKLQSFMEGDWIDARHFAWGSLEHQR